MEFGNIFKTVTGKEPSKLSLIAIEEEAVKNPKYKKYGGNLILPRGSVFKNKFMNIDDNMDKMFKKLGFSR